MEGSVFGPKVKERSVFGPKVKERSVFGLSSSRKGCFWPRLSQEYVFSAMLYSRPKSIYT